MNLDEFQELVAIRIALERIASATEEANKQRMITEEALLAIVKDLRSV